MLGRLVPALGLLTALYGVSWSVSGTASAQEQKPTASIAASYPGTIRLDVDATDIDRRIFNVRETIPVKAGPLTLYYPEWLPGNHGPNGAVDRLAGLTITANGRPVPWTRDPASVFSFRVDVPADARELDVAFQFLTPLAPGQGRIMISPDLLNLQWNAVVLYPAGVDAAGIMVESTVRLPQGWSFATALESTANANGAASFKAVSLDTLVDSPMMAGRYFKRFDLDGGKSRVSLNVFADTAEQLEAKPAQLEAHRTLVRQADKLFGARHFDHYDFLLALTERIGGIGLEHHRSSENGTEPTYFSEWDKAPAGRDLLPHEYTHSWNGKFRRPADLWTPHFNTPMQDSLLWVYEGQTQYWGFVLSARSGMMSKQSVLDAIGGIAAGLNDAKPGRDWKTLQDTTNDPITARRRPQPWNSWQRSEDYYNEGMLLWLDADTLIREQSKGKKSLDDFARVFFGVEDGRWTPLTYTFDDVVAALNAVHPHDWKKFLRDRLDGHGPGAPLEGLTRGGYRIVFSDKPTEMSKANETRGKIVDLTYTLGMTLRRDGEVAGVVWNGLAFQAGLAMGVKIIAVNGIAFDVDRLKTVLKTSGTVDFLIRTGDVFKTVKLENHGLRYPRLERIADTTATLDDILAPRK